MEQRELIRRILEAIGSQALGYGLRARVPDLFFRCDPEAGQIDYKRMREILEAKEEAVDAVYMTVLQICAEADPDARATLRFINGDGPLE